MEKLIAADCTIALGGVTLLELGVDYMLEESHLAQSRLVQTVQPIRATHAQAIPRHNKRHAWSWSRVKTFGTADEARQFKALHAIELPDAEGDCTVTYSNGLVFTLSNAALSADCYEARTEAQLFIATYRITCGEIAVTTPAS